MEDKRAVEKEKEKMEVERAVEKEKYGILYDENGNYKSIVDWKLEDNESEEELGESANFDEHGNPLFHVPSVDDNRLTDLLLNVASPVTGVATSVCDDQGGEPVSGFKRVWKDTHWIYMTIDEQPDIDFTYDLREEVWRWKEDPSMWDGEGHPDFDPFSEQLRRFRATIRPKYGL